MCSDEFFLKHALAVSTIQV